MCWMDGDFFCQLIKRISTDVSFRDVGNYSLEPGRFFPIRTLLIEPTGPSEQSKDVAFDDEIRKLIEIMIFAIKVQTDPLEVTSQQMWKVFDMPQTQF